MAIAPSIYHVRYSDWTSGNLHEIVIQPSQVDNSTSLTLPGSGKIDYGQFWDQNALFLMEHFAKNTAPTNPVQGQIWFHKGQKKLRLYDLSSDPSFNNWSSIQQTRFGTVHPGSPNTGDFFYSTTSNSFEYWDGSVWQTFLTSSVGNSTYVLKAGDTMTGDLNMGGTHKVTGLASPTVASDATNKTYVDTQDSLRVEKAGDTMTGFLTLSANPTSALHASTKSYVDTQDALKVAKAGDTMTGDLTINKVDPTLHLTGAATSVRAISIESSGVRRWGFGSAGPAESGSNTGSAFTLSRHNDAGTQIDTPFTIDRQSGRIIIGAATTGNNELVNACSLKVNARVVEIDSTLYGNAPTDLMLNGTGSAAKYLSYRTNGSATTSTGFRWFAGIQNNEAGGNSGSDYFLSRYSDTGVYLGTPLTISRQTGNWNVGGSVIQNVSNPVNPQDAATKSYVDSTAAASTVLIPSGGYLIFNSTGGWAWQQVDATPYIGAISARYIILEYRYALNEPDSGDAVIYIKGRAQAGAAEYILAQGRSSGSRDNNADAAQVMVPMTANRTFELWIGNNSMNFGFNFGCQVLMIGYVK